MTILNNASNPIRSQETGTHNLLARDFAAFAYLWFCLFVCENNTPFLVFFDRRVAIYKGAHIFKYLQNSRINFQKQPCPR